jgi:hypothetical protein
MEIRKQKCRWIGHTLRKEDEQPPRWNPQGNRERGRPRNSWRRSTLRGAGKSWIQLTYLATVREKWKKLADD